MKYPEQEKQRAQKTFCGVILHLQDTEQLLHVSPLSFQQLVHNMSAERQRQRDQVRGLVYSDSCTEL